MKIYTVGGAVRDTLLGLPVLDRDYVVVGASPEQMAALGFRPVGKDFPVFLHPSTHEEYALARTERKTAPGYKGFAFHAASDVTLEQDLARRDLTINAIAMDGSGQLIDPFGGQNDLRARVFRHTSPAFGEDPVRILRLARFAARFGDFTVAPETLRLMRQMVENGEADALVAERVWQELARGMMEAQPSRMFAVLREGGALRRILPELDRLWGVPQPPQHHPEIDTGLHAMLALDYAARQNYALPVRFAALTHDLGKGLTAVTEWPRHHGHEHAGIALIESVCQRLKIPNDCRDLAVMTAREHGRIGQAGELRPDTIVELLERCDAFRKPDRFAGMLLATECDRRGRGGQANDPAGQPFHQGIRLLTALQAARSIKAGEIARNFAGQPERIPGAIHGARVAAVRAIAGTLQNALPKDR